MMNDDNPTKDLTGSEKLDRILSRFDRLEGRFGGMEDRLGKLEDRFGGVENRLSSIEGDRARETRKLDTVLAAVQQLQEELKEVKFELRRLNTVFEKVAGDQHHH
jgi:chromosome segregation ATPase